MRCTLIAKYKSKRNKNCYKVRLVTKVLYQKLGTDYDGTYAFAGTPKWIRAFITTLDYKLSMSAILIWKMDFIHGYLLNEVYICKPECYRILMRKTRHVDTTKFLMDLKEIPQDHGI